MSPAAVSEQTYESDQSEVLVRYAQYAHYVNTLDPWEKFTLVKRIENEFINQCDTELGDFLNDYMLLILQEDFGQLKNLVDEFDLNPEMMMCVADSLEELRV